MVLVLFLFFTYGIIIGSFLNVCICRIPLNQNIAIGSSHCIRCNEKIKFYDLFPIVSYIFLRGRCRHCKEKISIRYPLVELMNGVLYMLVFQVYSFSTISFVICIFFSTLIVLAFIDLEYMLVPDILNIVIVILAIFAVFFEYKTLHEHLLGFIAVSVPMFLIVHLTKGFGIGDVFLYASAGLLLGYKLTILSFVIACGCATVFGLWLICIKGTSKKSKIPFVPFIAIGLIVATLYGESILKWYIDLIL